MLALCLSSCGQQEQVATVKTGDESKAIFKQQSQPEQAPQVVPAEPQARTSPFLTEEEEKNYRYLGKNILIDYLAVSGIIYSPAGSRAIINGQILSVGDRVDNKEIIEILPEAVILKDAQSQYMVKLKNVVEK